jgi:hypothetical protein
LVTQAELALDARPAETGATLGYREEVYHPSLSSPVVAHGWFEHASDGTLIRHQTDPQAETMTIGRRYIHRLREASGFSTTVSIPSELAPLLEIVRGVVSDNHEAMLGLMEDYSADIQNGDAGWSLTLTDNRETGVANTLVLYGCGDLLQAVEVQLPDSSRRRYVFEDRS